MFGGYSYGKRHLGKVIPTQDRVITIGNPPPHPTIFVGPVTVAELKKRMEIDAKKLEKKMQQRKCLGEKNQNEMMDFSENVLTCAPGDKENVPCGETAASFAPPDNYSFSSKDSSNCSNHTYTLDNSDQKSPSHNLNSTYDKFDETEDFNLQIEITQNLTSIQERKSVNKSMFRNYRQNRADSMASDIHMHVDKTADISQLTDASNMNCTNRSVLLSFNNLKLDDECGNITNTSMKAYKDSPVAKILMDDKFCRDGRSPTRNKSRNSTPARKNASSNAERQPSAPNTPKSSVRKSVSKHEDIPATPATTPIRKSISKNKVEKSSTPKSTPARKSLFESTQGGASATPKSTPTRKSLFDAPKSTPTRKSILKNTAEMFDAPKSTPARKSILKNKDDSILKQSTATLRTSSSSKRKFSHVFDDDLLNTSTQNSPAIRKSLLLLDEDLLNTSTQNSPLIRKSLLLNKENISVRKTPGKMSATLITDLKPENCLINSSFRDSTDNSTNRSTPDVFHKIPNEMWKSHLENVPEKTSTTPFKSKLPQLKKTPKKYDHVKSPVSKYIYRGEGIKSMSKLRHSSCVNELVAKSKSETKKEHSESKNKPCKIPQRCTSVQRKLDLPKMKKGEISNPSVVSRTSSFRN
ncbi:WASH complex subunit 2-like [Planococcus citri]|uniref:WASH complex subunit 2-like n=1 Tax=Planococcus citri TaxID=170843 RepID=UPI0031F7409D